MPFSASFYQLQKEYADELAEFRKREDPQQTIGKVFVRIDSFTPSDIPIPQQPTRFDLFLNNGLNEVKAAGGGRLVPGQPTCVIGQEFELLQHKGLQFNLTLRVIKDAHLRPQTMQIPVPAVIPSPAGHFSTGSEPSPQGHKKEKLISRIFGSPKKQKHASSAPSVNQGVDRPSSPNPAASVMRTVTRPPEPILGYMNREGDLARAHVNFEQLAAQMLGQATTFHLPLRGVSNPPPSLSSALGQRRGMTAMGMLGTDLDSGFAEEELARNVSQPRGTLDVTMFFVPSVAGLKPLVPARLTECVQAMAMAREEKEVKWAGVLTQQGGDSGKTWRRRWIELRGRKLLCLNEITRKRVGEICLSSAVAVEESRDPLSTPSPVANLSDASRISPNLVNSSFASSRGGYSAVEEEDFYEVERSFRIRLRGGDVIRFFADTDQDKERWTEELRSVLASFSSPSLGGNGLTSTHTSTSTPTPTPTPDWARHTLSVLEQFQRGDVTLQTILAPPQRRPHMPSRAYTPASAEPCFEEEEGPKMPTFPKLPPLSQPLHLPQSSVPRSTSPQSGTLAAGTPPEGHSRTSANHEMNHAPSPGSYVSHSYAAASTHQTPMHGHPPHHPRPPSALPRPVSRIGREWGDTLHLDERTSSRSPSVLFAPTRRMARPQSMLEHSKSSTSLHGSTGQGAVLSSNASAIPRPTSILVNGDVGSRGRNLAGRSARG